MRNLILGILIGVGMLGSFVFGNKYKNILPTAVVTSEESTVIKVVESATPSVVTVSISKPAGTRDILGFFGRSTQSVGPVEQDIGTGFVIDKTGMIATNKHVVSDTSAKYKVIINKDGKDEAVDVEKIYRDPQTDLAILKVNRTDLIPVILGDSTKLKAGQLVVAIGTALGEFRSTVTTGVISGLGRGITAGSVFEGSEKLENVIQTDAAINPGNSGGPLLNSSGEVIGVNTAVSTSAQNIGFAIPINIVKESIANFNSTGQFERPYLGVSYKMIGKRAAILNDLPQGGYVEEVLEDSPAKAAGIQAEDIIVEIDGQKLSEENGKTLADFISKKKLGDSVSLKISREGKDIDIQVKLDKSR